MTINPEIFEDLIFYMHEREKIRLRKEAGAPRPWTIDPALANYRFTNVLRENDYTTQWLIKNWYQPNSEEGLETLLMNAGIARYFGTTEFCGEIGFSFAWDKERIRQSAHSRMSRGERVFTSAYVITNGGISDAKYNVVLDYYLDPFVAAGNLLCKIAVETQRWEEMGRYMMNHLQGFGGTGFMTKEVLSDFILATRHRIEWKDLYDWTPIGPGAVKGLNWLHDRDPSTKLRKEKALEELIEIAEMVGPRLEAWMPQWRRELDLHAIQFQMCELSKYCKVKYNGERMKNNYRPRSV